MPELYDYLNKARPLVDMLFEYLFHTKDGMFILGVFFSFFFMWLFMRGRHKKIVIIRRENVAEKERHEEVQRILSDHVFTVLDDLHYKGLITRDEERYWSIKFGHMGLKDLLPRGVKPACELKLEIKKKRADKKPVSSPSPIPDIPGQHPLTEPRKKDVVEKVKTTVSNALMNLTKFKMGG